MIGKYADPNGKIVDFGYSLCLHESTAFVGGAPGIVYGYERSGPSWKLSAALPAPPGASGFGKSISVYDDYLLVGANAETVGGAVGAGGVHIYHRLGADWQKAGALYANPPVEGDWMGWSVALAENVAVVGAVRYDTGKVYIFERNLEGLWTQVATLLPDLPGSGEHFGWSVAIDGETIVVGAPFDWTTGLTAGASYLFERDASQNWTRVAKLIAPDPVSLGLFGISVAVSGDVCLVGSKGADVICCAEGATYCYERVSPGAWGQTAKLVSSVPQNSEVFGASVSLHGDLAIIGALGANDFGTESGASYVFARRAGGPWKQVARLTAPDLQAWNNFGNAVALSGNMALIGTWPQEPDPPWKAGAAYLFAVGPDANNNGLMDPCECPGDLNKDWIVDQADLGLLLQNWGCTGGLGYDPSNKPCLSAQTGCCGDLDADGDVDHADLGILLKSYGNICP